MEGRCRIGICEGLHVPGQNLRALRRSAKLNGVLPGHMGDFVRCQAKVGLPARNDQRRIGSDPVLRVRLATVETESVKDGLDQVWIGLACTRACARTVRRDGSYDGS